MNKKLQLTSLARNVLKTGQLSNLMKDYKVLNNYLDEEKVYDGQNYTLYKVYKESNLNELLDDESFLNKNMA